LPTPALPLGIDLHCPTDIAAQLRLPTRRGEACPRPPLPHRRNIEFQPTPPAPLPSAPRPSATRGSGLYARHPGSPQWSGR